MRSSVPEGPHAPRTKQAPPSSGSSGVTAGPTGVTPPVSHTASSPSSRSQISSAHNSRTPSSSLPPTPTASSRVAPHSRTLTGYPHQPLQRSQPHQRSPAPPTSAHQLQNIGLSGSKQHPQQTQTPAKSIQARISQANSSKASPQTAKACSVTGQRQPDGAPSRQQPSAPSPKSPKLPPNFGEYDDQEWDVGVGHLIIDLDADIAQTDRSTQGTPGGGPAQANSTPGTPVGGSTQGVGGSEDKHSLKMKIKRTKPPTKTSEAKHEIVKADVVAISKMTGPASGPAGASLHNGPIVNVESATPRGPAGGRPIFKKEKRRLELNGSVPSPPPNSSPSSNRPIAPSTHTLVTSSSTIPATVAGFINSSVSLGFASSSPSGGALTSQNAITPPQLAAPISSSSGNQVVQVKAERRPPSSLSSGTSIRVQQETASVPSSKMVSTQPDDRGASQVNKKPKLSEEICKKDACVGTSVGTMTEPECFGPCEPGSSVTLEGIVWHETEGVLVVNVTWRGKTYVGTLLDCTKHDWAPPRFCDSPTSDIESRTPKGRAKRGRSAASSTCATSTAHTPTTELSVTETRSGKLRNSTIKGRRGTPTTFNQPSSPAKATETVNAKRKGRDAESSLTSDAKGNKRVKLSPGETVTSNGCNSPLGETYDETHPQQTSDHVELVEPPVSPQLIECPEPNCSKKYKHINGLKYHQSHAHSNSHIENESSENRGDSSENEERNRQTSPKPVTSTPVDATSTDLIKPAVLRPTTFSSSVVSDLSGSGLRESSESSETVGTVQSCANGGIPQRPSVVPIGGMLHVIEAGDDSLKNQSGGQSSETHGTQKQTLEEKQYIAQSPSSKLLQTPPSYIAQGIPHPQMSTHISPSYSPLNTSLVHTQCHSLSQPQTVHINHTSNLHSLSPHLSPHHLHSSQPHTPAHYHTSQTSPSHIMGLSTTQPILHPQPSVTLPHSYMSSQLQTYPYIIEACSPTMASQLNSLQTGRVTVVDDTESRSSGDNISPTQTSPTVTMTNNKAGIPLGMADIPGLAPLAVKDGIPSDKLIGKPKDLVNGLPPKKEEEPNREDARSPAYSDISDANDSTPVIDGEGEPKDFKDEKKPELPIGPTSAYAYGLYFGAYGQTPQPYLIPPLQPPSSSLQLQKHSDGKDKQMDKDKNEGMGPLPPGNEYMKFPQQYLYSYPHIYAQGYPEPYMRDPIYKEMLDKSKLDLKEAQMMDELEKGPTDLSRGTSNGPPDKGMITFKDLSALGGLSIAKELLDARSAQVRGQVCADKRLFEQGLPYRYSGGGYDSQPPMVGIPMDKPCDQKLVVNTCKSMTPVSLSSPRLGSSANGVNKDEKNGKRTEIKCEGGIKPTMETTGPPPSSASAPYYPPFPYSHVAFDPYRPPMVPSLSLPAGFPPSYLHGHAPGIGLRYPLGMPNIPEDLSRSAVGSSILASQSGLYTGAHKMAELQERAQKSPLGQPRGGSPITLLGGGQVSLPSPHSFPPISSSPSFSPSFGNVVVSQAGVLHMAERKTPPIGARMTHPHHHHHHHEGYAYPLLPAQFPPHFAALGVNPNATLGGPPSGMGGVGLPK